MSDVNQNQTQNKQIEQTAKSNEFANGMMEAIGIKEMTYCCIIFNWEKNDPVRANVEYLLDGRKVNKLLELLKNGKWRVNEL